MRGRLGERELGRKAVGKTACEKETVRWKLGREIREKGSLGRRNWEKELGRKAD